MRRLVEADYHRRPGRPSRARVRFWLAEARTPALLLELCQDHPAMARAVARNREAVRLALEGDAGPVKEALDREQEAEAKADREYWRPLRADLERWRRERGPRGREGTRR